jgi:hypothetical protein
MLFIQGHRANRPVTTFIRLCCTIYRDSNKDAFICSVYYSKQVRQITDTWTEKLWWATFGLIKYGIDKYVRQNQNNCKRKQNDSIIQQQFELWTTEYSKEIYITYNSETVRGSAFIWSINQIYNSCDTQPWQRVTRMAQLFSDFNNTPDSKQIHPQNYTRRTNRLQISKHGQNINKDKSDKLCKKYY